MAAMLKGEKLGENKRHISFPPDLERKLEMLAAVKSLSFNALVIAICDEHIHGNRVVRILENQGDGGK